MHELFYYLSVCLSAQYRCSSSVSTMHPTGRPPAALLSSWLRSIVFLESMSCKRASRWQQNNRNCPPRKNISSSLKGQHTTMGFCGYPATIWGSECFYMKNLALTVASHVAVCWCWWSQWLDIFHPQTEPNSVCKTQMGKFSLLKRHLPASLKPNSKSKMYTAHSCSCVAV